MARFNVYTSHGQLKFSFRKEDPKGMSAFCKSNGEGQWIVVEGFTLNVSGGFWSSATLHFNETDLIVRI